MLQLLIDRMVAAKVPPSIPWLPGLGRTDVPAILCEGGALAGLEADFLAAQSDVRSRQLVGTKPRAPLGAAKFTAWWRAEFEERCKPGDAEAFRCLAAEHGLEVPELRALRGRACGESGKRARQQLSENAPMRSPPRPEQSAASPLASLPSAPRQAAAASRTRGAVERRAECTPG